MVIIIPPVCYNCKYFNKNREQQGYFECKAYPFGIPEEILTSEIDHTKPYKGDNGIQFEPINEY